MLMSLVLTRNCPSSDNTRSDRCEILRALRSYGGSRKIANCKYCFAISMKYSNTTCLIVNLIMLLCVSSGFH